jgi:ribosomal protein S18 acetylase RimI-like enzyme
MRIVQRRYTGQQDQLQMMALARAAADDHLHVTDLPYRLSSWALDDLANISLWCDERNNLLGWAVLQTPFWTIDFVIRPDMDSTLLPLIVVWADERALALADTPDGHPTWFTNVFARQQARITALNMAGFADQAHVSVDAWSKVLLRLTESPPVAHSFENGFVIRPLRGTAEVDAYVDLHRAVFESKSMTREWRMRTLQQPAYQPELDLVVESPNGRLAGFCIGWFATSGLGGLPTGQIEPLGVHAEFRGRGLATAILSECVQRMFTLGAKQVLVETDNYRDAALELYLRAGFTVYQDVRVLRKDYI